MFKILFDVNSLDEVTELRSRALALAEAGGLTLAYCSDWPISFWIMALSGIIYLMSLVARFQVR